MQKNSTRREAKCNWEISWYHTLRSLGGFFRGFRLFCHFRRETHFVCGDQWVWLRLDMVQWADRYLMSNLSPFSSTWLHMPFIYLVLMNSQSVSGVVQFCYPLSRGNFVKVGLLRSHNVFVGVVVAAWMDGQCGLLVGKRRRQRNLPWKRGERLSPSTKLNCKPRWYIKSRMNGGDKQETLPRYYSCWCCHVTTQRPQNIPCGPWSPCLPPPISYMPHLGNHSETMGNRSSIWRMRRSSRRAIANKDRSERNPTNTTTPITTRFSCPRCGFLLLFVSL